MTHLVARERCWYAAGESGGDPVRERLESWKEIAAYLGREVRTVQRWALGCQLPVHRLPAGGTRPRVFALKPEIDAWMRTGTKEPHEDTVSVAVLPFQNLGSGADGGYFGDGLADDVINALVRIPGLRVVARTSSFAFTARGQDVRSIGARLRATWLIEGSVRRDRNQVRVSAQLVNARDGYHAWSESFDRKLTDVFAVQDDIARSIARALNLRLTRHAPASRQTEDLAAYDLWMKGRSISHQFTPTALADARRCYEAAIARDPRFSRPYYGLAELLFSAVQFGFTTSTGDVARAREAIARSLDLDDGFGEAHGLLGVFLGVWDYDWTAADAAFRRAFALSPGSSNVLIRHAWFCLVPRMRIDQARDEAQQAVALDPLSPLTHARLGLVHMTARQYAAAVESCRTAVELAPGLWWLHWFYGTALLLEGKRAEGFRQSRKAYDQVHQPMMAGAMCLLCGLFRQRKRAKQLLAELQDMAGAAYVPPAAFALAYVGLGDDRAFEWLHKAIDARDPIVTHLPSMPFYDGIRDDARFPALLGRMHLA